MWSDQYRYYSIRSDADYSRSLPTSQVVRLLEKINILRKNAPQVFISKKGLPRIDLTCVDSNKGTFAHNDSGQTEYINLINIVASRQYPESEQMYIDLLKSLANELKWDLILDEDDEGNENIKLN